ncbi:MAG: hypothetical protein GY927_23730, partial [bacterium]|nr:hypothetical protein [bacterium]
MEPYKGLQPYTEDNEDIFFGRDAEKAILIDKVLSDKLTLLFAATGVGKSSLLQAAVMPELKRPSRENLDVVYYNDWVSPPLEELQNTILNSLKERGKIDEQFPSWEGQGVGSGPGINARSESSSRLKPADSEEQSDSSPLSSQPGILTPGTGDSTSGFKDFLSLCATFSSEPLVIILDQFEEFFQYQRYSEHFEPFIAQLSEAVRDKETPAVFLISMREDFALNLNAFKGHLSNTLFENYYRLEKLELNEAKAAIEEPVKKVGFRYEEGLLDELLRDLAEQERENRIGSRKEIVPEQAPSFVEPPNVQIVCTQLWEEEQHNPGKTIRKQTYKQHEGAKGFIGSYFKKVIDRFSLEEKKIASKAFDHLVTPRGTKMAYPVKDLSDKLRVKEKELDTVLARLEKARVLRSQKRKDELWYELYHDTFSGIIYRWNSDYKAKQRAKRYAIGGIIALLVLAALGILYDVTLNLTNYHLRLKILKEEPSHIELYRGKAGSWDLFGLQKYLKESAYNFEEIEPDKLFTASEPVGEYGNLTVELI